MAAIVTLAAIGVLVTTVPAEAATGLRVTNGRLTEANGNALVLRGVNVAHTWFKSSTPKALADVKALGANSVRIVLSAGTSGGQPDSASSVATVLSQCKANRLICMFEVHSTTGYTGPGTGASLAQAAAYWVSIADVFRGQENYAIINIGNEPWGNSNVSQWTGATTDAIRTIRAAGLDNTLVVDAPNWGQDSSSTMRDNAQTVFNADVDRNTVFSVHMYGVYGSGDKIRSYVDGFRARGLPLIIGEFGWTHSDGNVDEATIFSHARQTGTGWLAWSWCGNGSPVQYLDMKTGGCGGTSLSAWGNQVRAAFADSREATIFGRTQPTTQPSTPRPTPTSSATPSSGFPYCLAGRYVDPDGDGWGWQDNSFSCIVRGGRADSTPTSPSTPQPSATRAANGYLYCVTGRYVDPDGDGWGWQDNSFSCVVRGSGADPGPGSGGAAPTTSQPTTSQPTTSQPTTSQPTTSQPTTSQPTTSQPSTTRPPAPGGTPVDRWGQLRVCGAKICDKNNSPVQLRGVSSMWLNWENNGYAESRDALVWMRDTWGLTVIRAAVGVEPDGAYLSNPAKARAQVERIIENARAAGVYVIVDWHAHNAEDHRPQSQAFFADLASRYGHLPNVIWETYNEPLQVSWTSVLKPYHEAVIRSIRTSDPDNLIILGTPTWSQGVDQAAASPVAGTNLAYTLHFYSCTHTSGLRAKADAARRAGLPLFVTEWGATHADGGTDGRVCQGEAQAWVDWMKTNGISWAAWKLDDCAGDSSCLLNPGAPVNGRWDSWLHGHAPFVRDSIRG